MQPNPIIFYQASPAFREAITSIIFNKWIIKMHLKTLHGILILQETMLLKLLKMLQRRLPEQLFQIVRISRIKNKFRIKILILSHKHLIILIFTQSWIYLSVKMINLLSTRTTSKTNSIELKVNKKRKIVSLQLCHQLLINKNKINSSNIKEEMCKKCHQ